MIEHYEVYIKRNFQNWYDLSALPFEIRTDIKVTKG